MWSVATYILLPCGQLRRSTFFSTVYPQGKLYSQNLVSFQMTTTVYLQGTVSLSWARPPWGRTPLKNTELCVSEPEHTLPDGSSLGAPIARLPALSGIPRPYPMPPAPDLQTVP